VLPSKIVSSQAIPCDAISGGDSLAISRSSCLRVLGLVLVAGSLTACGSSTSPGGSSHSATGSSATTQASSSGTGHGSSTKSSNTTAPLTGFKACQLLSGTVVAKMFGSAEPKGDKPQASPQSRATACVWTAGLTAAQAQGNASAASAELELTYDEADATASADAQSFVKLQCFASPQSVSGVGSNAYYCNGSMAASQGNVLVEIESMGISPAPSELSEAAALTTALGKLT